jgi:uncharacterized paraquat-inducible protein A
MDTNDIKSLSEKTREDGKRLFRVSEFIYKFSIFVVWVIGILGTIISLFLMLKISFWLGFGILLFAALICFASYITAVLTTHIAKVMVHTSFSSIAILEHFSKN